MQATGLSNELRFQQLLHQIEKDKASLEEKQRQFDEKPGLIERQKQIDVLEKKLLEFSKPTSMAVVAPNTEPGKKALIEKALIEKQIQALRNKSGGGISDLPTETGAPTQKTIPFNSIVKPK